MKISLFTSISDGLGKHSETYFRVQIVPNRGENSAASAPEIRVSIIFFKVFGMKIKSHPALLNRANPLACTLESLGPAGYVLRSLKAQAGPGLNLR